MDDKCTRNTSSTNLPISSFPFTVVSLPLLHMGRQLGDTLRADYARREIAVRSKLRESMNAALGEGCLPINLGLRSHTFDMFSQIDRQAQCSNALVCDGLLQPGLSPIPYQIGWLASEYHFLQLEPDHRLYSHRPSF